MITAPSSSPSVADTELVQASLAGNRDAFGSIVIRYQSLVCSLAYSATGSFDRSEDLAQQTFVTAWQRLSELREPAKLRAWLCGIARNLISNAQRRAGRDPASLGEPLTAEHEVIAPEVSPSDQAVSREEQAILWRALQHIPENYREPLVLYYREQQSIRNVAEALELSEDAVKQRLVRGRSLLHEQVLALVEGTLARSKPGPKFTHDVMAAVPLVGTGTATAYATATHGTAGSKGAPWLATMGTLVSAQLLWFVSSVAFVAGIGAFAGWQMGSPAASLSERRRALWFWRLLVLGLAAFVLPVTLLETGGKTTPVMLSALPVWLALFYVVTGTPLVLWAIANHQRIRTGTAHPAASVPDPSLRRWVTAGMVGLAALLLWGLSRTHWSENIRADQTWTVISSHPEANLRINELENGGRWIEIDATQAGSTMRWRGPLSEETFQRLKQAGLRYETRRQGRDYEVLGWPARRFSLVLILGLSAGGLLLYRISYRKPRMG